MYDDPRPYVLAETNYREVKKDKFTIAVLPWGATEAHNYHLPYATDNVLAEESAIAAAKIAWAKGAKPVVLPTIPFGVNTGQMEVPLCMNMNPSTQYAVLKDLVQVLNKQGVYKMVVVNAHGGNNFKQMIRELSVVFPEVFVCSLNWWQVLDSTPYFEEAGDHAGELETSAMMHLAPQWVSSLEMASSGAAKTYKIEGLKEGWVSAQRDWPSVTEDTGVGNPKASTKEKGAAFFEDVTQKIAGFLEELHHADLNQMYE